MQRYMSETNKVLHNIQNSITKYEADKNVCISDCNTIHSLRSTMNSYKSETDTIITDLNNVVTNCKSQQTIYSEMVNKLRTECSQLFEQLKTIYYTVATQCATNDINNDSILQYESEVATINDSIAKSISNYKLERLTIDSIQTTIDKYKLDTNIIINNLNTTMTNVKSEHALLLRKDDNNNVQDLRLKMDLLDRDRNLARNEYLELPKD